MICSRCETKTSISTGSFFNSEQICTDCDGEERVHPNYAEAKRVESEHVRKGNYNYPGIGLPCELRTQALERVSRKHPAEGVAVQEGDR